MSSGTVKNENDDYEKNEFTSLNSNILTETIFYDISNLVVSFLNLSNRYPSKYLYPEGIKVPFKSIDTEFQSILKQEFADVLEDFMNSIKNK